jgi:hypothetical protein
MEFWPLKTLSEVSGVLLGLQLSPTPNMGVHLGVWGFTPSHSLHSREHVMWLSSLLLGPQPLNLLALVASQMLGLWHYKYYKTWINCKKILLWGLKAFDMWQLVKDLNMIILKSLDQLAQHCPNLTPLTMWYCLLGNIGYHVLLMWATNQVVVVTTS